MRYYRLVANNRIYIVLTLVFMALSITGLIFFYRPSPSSLLPPPIPTASPSSVILPSSAQSQPTLLPTGTNSVLTSDKYGFTAAYNSNRNLSETPENGGTRYTLLSDSGIITLHVGPQWSWDHPNRQFNSLQLVSGQPTFVYQTTTQTLVDFQIGNNYFTIQCVHNGTAALRDECQQFITDFHQTSGSAN